MKFCARVFVSVRVQEPYICQVHCRPGVKFKKYCVVQILAGVPQNAQRLAAPDDEDVIREVVGAQRLRGRGLAAQLAQALLGKTYCPGRPPKNGNARKRLAAGDFHAADRLRVLRVYWRIRDDAGLRIGVALGIDGVELDLGRAPGGIAKQYRTASSPWFTMGQKPCGACPMK